jgi:hypothetical protein
MSATPVPDVTAKPKSVLRGVRLGRYVDSVSERRPLAKTSDMGHAEFLEVVLFSDEVTRRAA